MSHPPPVNSPTPAESPIEASDISKPASADTGIMGAITEKLGLNGGKGRRGRRFKTRRGGNAGPGETKGLYTGFNVVNVTGGKRSRRSRPSRRSKRVGRKSRRNRRTKK